MHWLLFLILSSNSLTIFLDVSQPVSGLSMPNGLVVVGSRGYKGVTALHNNVTVYPEYPSCCIIFLHFRGNGIRKTLLMDLCIANGYTAIYQQCSTCVYTSALCNPSSRESLNSCFHPRWITTKSAGLRRPDHRTAH